MKIVKEEVCRTDAVPGLTEYMDAIPRAKFDFMCDHAFVLNEEHRMYSLTQTFLLDHFFACKTQYDLRRAYE